MTRAKLTPDAGVSVPKVRGRGRPVDPDLQAEVNKILNMKIGASFFVQGARSSDLEYLRRPVKRAGGGIMIREVEDDEIYHKPGVRCWRVAGTNDS